MNKIFFYSGIIFFFVSCSSREIIIPNGVIPRDSMVLVLTDVQIAEASMMYQNNKGNISDSKTPDYYQFVFNKHHITEKQFRESFSFYAGQVEMMDKIYEEVITEISKRQAEVSNK